MDKRYGEAIAQRAGKSLDTSALIYAYLGAKASGHPTTGNWQVVKEKDTVFVSALHD